MKNMIMLLWLLLTMQAGAQTMPAASPCAGDKTYRQFDFWLGNWEAFNLKGTKAGDSKISLILDSCIVLEEWTSTSAPGGRSYQGKSFNTYNAVTRQWQQSWVDNVGGSTNYFFGKFEGDKMVFQTAPVKTIKDTVVVMKLSFFNLGPDKVRQLGQISKDNGKTWATLYDLEYRRRKD